MTPDPFVGPGAALAGVSYSWPGIAPNPEALTSTTAGSTLQETARFSCWRTSDRLTPFCSCSKAVSRLGAHGSRASGGPCGLAPDGNGPAGGCDGRGVPC